MCLIKYPPIVALNFLSIFLSTSLFFFLFVLLFRCFVPFHRLQSFLSLLFTFLTLTSVGIVVLVVFCRGQLRDRLLPRRQRR